MSLRSPRLPEHQCSSSRLTCLSTSPSASPLTLDQILVARPSLSASSTIGRSCPAIPLTLDPRSTSSLRSARSARGWSQDVQTLTIIWTKCKLKMYFCLCQLKLGCGYFYTFTAFVLILDPFHSLHVFLSMSIKTWVRIFLYFHCFCPHFGPVSFATCIYIMIEICSNSAHI